MNLKFLKKKTTDLIFIPKISNYLICFLSPFEVQKQQSMIIKSKVNYFTKGIRVGLCKQKKILNNDQVIIKKVTVQLLEVAPGCHKNGHYWPHLYWIPPAANHIETLLMFFYSSILRLSAFAGEYMTMRHLNSQSRQIFHIKVKTLNLCWCSKGQIIQKSSKSEMCWSF